MQNRWSDFLDSVAVIGAKYASIWIGGKNEPLSLPFWTKAEIHKALPLRAEWGLDSRFTRSTVTGTTCFASLPLLAMSFI